MSTVYSQPESKQQNSLIMTFITAQLSAFEGILLKSFDFTQVRQKFTKTD